MVGTAKMGVGPIEKILCYTSFTVYCFSCRYWCGCLGGGRGDRERGLVPFPKTQKVKTRARLSMGICPKLAEHKRASPHSLLKQDAEKPPHS